MPCNPIKKALLIITLIAQLITLSHASDEECYTILKQKEPDLEKVLRYCPETQKQERTTGDYEDVALLNLVLGRYKDNLKPEMLEHKEKAALWISYSYYLLGEVQKSDRFMRDALKYNRYGLMDDIEIVPEVLSKLYPESKKSNQQWLERWLKLTKLFHRHYDKYLQEINKKTPSYDIEKLRSHSLPLAKAYEEFGNDKEAAEHYLYAQECSYVLEKYSTESNSSFGTDSFLICCTIISGDEKKRDETFEKIITKQLCRAQKHDLSSLYCSIKTLKRLYPQHKETITRGFEKWYRLVEPFSNINHISDDSSIEDKKIVTTEALLQAKRRYCTEGAVSYSMTQTELFLRYYHAYRFRSMIALAKEVIALAKNDKDRTYLEAMAAEGYFHLNDIQNGYKYFIVSFQARERYRDKSYPDMATILKYGIEQAMGEKDEERLVKLIIRYTEIMYDMEDPVGPAQEELFYRILAEEYRHQKDIPKARAYYEQVYLFRQKLLGKKHPATVEMRRVLEGLVGL